MSGRKNAEKEELLKQAQQIGKSKKGKADKSEEKSEMSPEQSNEKVENILNRAKAKGQITYGELAIELRGYKSRRS